MNNTHASNMKAADISEDVCHKRRLILEDYFGDRTGLSALGYDFDKKPGEVS